jgi:hypothetical protein
VEEDEQYSRCGGAGAGGAEEEEEAGKGEEGAATPELQAAFA